jgi:hypothetical protein
LTHAVCQVHLDVVVAVDQSAVELIANVLAAVELIAIEMIAMVGAVAVKRVTAALTGTEVTGVAEKGANRGFSFRIRMHIFGPCPRHGSNKSNSQNK